MANAGIRLDYAPLAPRRPRRRIPLLTFCLCAFVIAATTIWGRGLWRHAQVLYWQHQCLAYASPRDQIIIESDPAAAAVLLKNPHEWRPFGTGAARIAPKCLTQLNVVLSEPISAMSGAGVTFLHERRSKCGLRCLVVVSAPLDRAEPPFVGPVVPVFQDEPPVSRFALPRPPIAYAAWHATSILARHCQRTYAGQPDPNDESHFTIVYEQDGHKGIIDGWLCDDRTVKLTVLADLVPRLQHAPRPLPRPAPRDVPPAPGPIPITPSSRAREVMTA